MNARMLLHTPRAAVAAGLGTSGASTVRGDIASVANSLPQVVEVGLSKSVLAG